MRTIGLTFENEEKPQSPAGKKSTGKESAGKKSEIPSEPPEVAASSEEEQ